MEIKDKIRHHFSPIRVAKTRKLDNLLLVKLWSLTHSWWNMNCDNLYGDLAIPNKTTYAYVL